MSCDDASGLTGVITLTTHDGHVSAEAPPLEIIPLGGVGEFGMNMMVIACGETAIVVDAGVMFPEPELLGVDLDKAEQGDVATVGGLIMARLDRMPQPGDEVTRAGHRLRVEHLDGRRVAVVRLGPA